MPSPEEQSGDETVNLTAISARWSLPAEYAQTLAERDAKDEQSRAGVATADERARLARIYGQVDGTTLDHVERELKRTTTPLNAESPTTSSAPAPGRVSVSAYHGPPDPNADVISSGDKANPTHRRADAISNSRVIARVRMTEITIKDLQRSERSGRHRQNPERPAQGRGRKIALAVGSIVTGMALTIGPHAPEITAQTTALTKQVNNFFSLDIFSVW